MSMTSSVVRNRMRRRSSSSTTRTRVGWSGPSRGCGPPRLGCAGRSEAGATSCAGGEDRVGLPAPGIPSRPASSSSVSAGRTRLRGPDDGALQLREGRALDAVSCRACFEHRADDGAVVGAGESDDPDTREGGCDLARRRDTVEDRHADVHEDHVRREGEREVDRLLAVARLADDRDLRVRWRASCAARFGGTPSLRR